MIGKISIIYCALFCILLNPNFSLAQQTNVAKSMLTIGTYKSERCGLINSRNRTIYDKPEPEDTISTQIRKHIGAEQVGTGFIYEYNNKKYVVTCEHVILKAGKIIGYNSSYDKGYELKLVGGDTFYDIAVLEFVNDDEATQFESVKLETRLPNKGDNIRSMGYWNLDNQLMRFSGEVLDNNSIESNSKLDIPKLGFIKSTAKLPKGYSGGILLNKKNKVLGMNVMRYADKGHYFALQSRIVERIVKDIVEHEEVQRAFTGIQFAQLVDNKGQPVERIGISEIISNSPASKYRDQLENQVVKSINGKPVKDIYDVLQIMENIRPCTSVTIELDANNQYQKFTITPELLEREQLRQIAEHTVQYHKDVFIKGDAIILNNNKTQQVATVAGVNNIDVYCINSVEQLGILVRIFGFHQRIKIGTDDNIRKSGREIYFSEDDKMILYY